MTWQFSNEIDDVTCKRIINLGKGKWEKGGIRKDGDLNKDKRNSKIAWTTEQWVADLVFKYMHIANKNSGWNFKIDAAEPMQIAKYGVGGHYEDHFDGDGYTKYDKPENNWINGKTRKLSMTIVLNDDYEGGEFQFFAETDFRKEKTGTVIVFPSYMVHRVNPITKGTRYSLVVWFVGEPFQ
jgi:PKHD-type hydroxylase